jgi:hypothetical protein
MNKIWIRHEITKGIQRNYHRTPKTLDLGMTFIILEKSYKLN